MNLIQALFGPVCVCGDDCWLGLRRWVAKALVRRGQVLLEEVDLRCESSVGVSIEALVVASGG